MVDITVLKHPFALKAIDGSSSVLVFFSRVDPYFLDFTHPTTGDHCSIPAENVDKAIREGFLRCQVLDIKTARALYE